MTLSHRAQIKRFTSDLQKIVKAQYGKQLKLSSFTDNYSKLVFENRYSEIFKVFIVEKLRRPVSGAR